MADGAREFEMVILDTRFGIRHALARVAFITFLLLTLLIAGGCSGSSRLTATPSAASTPPATVDYAQAANEVLATPIPDGIAPQLWNELTAELAAQLKTVSREEVPPNLHEFEAGIELSAQPDGMHWYGPALHGDGNLDGVVNVADLTVLASHFGQSPGSTESYVDFNSDGIVNVSDVSKLAQNWGKRNYVYTVEWSYSPTGQFRPMPDDISAYFEDLQGATATYFVPFDGHGIRSLYYRLTYRKTEGLLITSHSITIAASDPYQPPSEPVSDVAAVVSSAGTITWSTRNVIPDGNQNGITEIYDVERLAQLFGQQWNDPEGGSYYQIAASADYDENGTIGIADVTPVRVHWGSYITRFVISVSTISDTEGFNEVGDVDYFTDFAGYNEYGFRYYDFAIPSPPPPPYWVTVTPYADDMPGVASTPLLVDAI